MFSSISSWSVGGRFEIGVSPFHPFFCTCLVSGKRCSWTTTCLGYVHKHPSCVVGWVWLVGRFLWLLPPYFLRFLWVQRPRSRRNLFLATFYITFATSLWTTTVAIMLGRFWLHLCDFLVIMGRLCWIKTGGWVLHLPQQGDLLHLRGPFATWNCDSAWHFFATCNMFKVSNVSNLEMKGPCKSRGFHTIYKNKEMFERLPENWHKDL